MEARKAGEIANYLRAHGSKYDDIKAMFERVYKIDGDEFEELMQEADRLESLE